MVPDDSASAPRLGDPEVQDRVQAVANRMVGELLGVDAMLADILDLAPAGDPDFAEELIVRELALIADGENPLRVSLRIALLSAARAALRCRGQIRALPEPACSLSVRAGTLTGTTPTSDRPWPRHATGTGISGRA